MYISIRAMVSSLIKWKQIVEEETLFKITSTYIYRDSLFLVKLASLIIVSSLIKSKKSRREETLLRSHILRAMIEQKHVNLKTFLLKC